MTTPESQEVACPKCGSTQIHAGAQGWTPRGGMLQSGKVQITCLKCGHKFLPGGKSAPDQTLAIIVLAIIGAIVFALFLMNM